MFLLKVAVRSGAMRNAFFFCQERSIKINSFMRFLRLFMEISGGFFTVEYAPKRTKMPPENTLSGGGLLK